MTLTLLAQPHVLAGGAFSSWKFTPATTTIDLIAASTNALNGALLARRPDHYKGYTVGGIILMAILGGIGGGVSRDVLLNVIPSPLTNPAYLFLCIVFGIAGYLLAYGPGQVFREGLFQFMTAFSLPWYAIVGAQKALGEHLPIIAAVLIGVVGATTGRYLIDVTSGVTAKQFVANEWFVGTAIVASCAWIALDKAGLTTWPSTLIAFLLAFGLRLAALHWRWEMPVPKEGTAPARSEDHI